MGIRLAFVSFPVLAIAAGAACSSSPEPAKSSAASSTSDAGAGTGPSQLADGCPVNSGFAGDDMCLAAPEATKGFQLHYGPTKYDDPTAEAPFVLQPGQETNDCYFQKASNTQQYVSGMQIWMRPGSHHLIVTTDQTSQADGFAQCSTANMAAGSLEGSQVPKLNDLTEAAPENEGLAIQLPLATETTLNFHVINTTSKPLLREAWMNYMYIDPSAIKGFKGNVFLVGGLGFQITPGTNKTYQYACSPDRPVRILNLASHMHAHTTRMSMWKVSNANSATPTTSLVYESYSWVNPVTFQYDSVHPSNPAPDRATQTPGASSGPLTLQPGDTLQWECAVDNTSDVTLTFRNEVYTGEMCIVTGVMVPTDDPMKPYDFSCALN